VRVWTQLFAHFGKRLQGADLFQVNDLVVEARQVCDDARQVGAAQLRNWRQCLDEKYADVKGIRDTRYIRVLRNDDGKTVLEVASSSSPDGVANAKPRTLFKAGQESRRLELRAKAVRGIEAKKHADLLFTYTHYIDRERHPAWLHDPFTGPEPANDAHLEE
jgi:pyruvate-formate lyase-activating enzyme